MNVKCTTNWLALFAIIITAACRSSEGSLGSSSVPHGSPVTALGTETSSVQSPVRSFDFANFTYPAEIVWGKGIESFTLRNGKYEGRASYEPVYLSFLVYGDVTGDGQEEALVTLVLSVRGTAIPFINYIYTAANGKPKLLSGFRNGDRADGGLRQIYAENGELVVERFSPVGKNGAFATQFSRTRYRWRGNRFQRHGAVEMLPNPTENSSPVMKPYHRSGEK